MLRGWIHNLVSWRSRLYTIFCVEARKPGSPGASLPLGAMPDCLWTEGSLYSDYMRENHLNRGSLRSPRRRIIRRVSFLFSIIWILKEECWEVESRILFLVRIFFTQYSVELRSSSPLFGFKRGMSRGWIQKHDYRLSGNEWDIHLFVGRLKALYISLGEVFSPH